MTSPSARPKLRRWRIVVAIAALLLLILGGGLWQSTRPKIDPRLVGTWSFSTRDRNPYEMNWCFFRDGTGEVWLRHPTSKKNPAGSGRKFYWQCQGSNFVLMPSPDTTWQQLKEELTRGYDRVCGNPTEDPTFSYALHDSAVDMEPLNKEAQKLSGLSVDFQLHRSGFTPKLFPRKSVN